MRKMILLLFILSFTFCEKSGFQDANLINKQWNLTSLQDTRTNTIINYPAYVKQQWGFEQIYFTTDSVSIKGLCNVGNAIFSTFSKNSAIKFSGFRITYAYCQYEQWEQYLLHNLDSAYTYKITGNQLVIYSRGTFNLNFVEQ